MLAGYFTDDDSDELTLDPVFTTLLDKGGHRIYSIRKPEMILLDIDATLFDTFGNQEGEAFNYHYSNHEYHPLLCYGG